MRYTQWEREAAPCAVAKTEEPASAQRHREGQDGNRNGKGACSEVGVKCKNAQVDDRRRGEHSRRHEVSEYSKHESRIG